MILNLLSSLNSLIPLKSLFTPMDFKLPKLNLILLAIALVIIIIGFALMTGQPSTETAFNPDIFSFRRITLGPMIALFGFVFMIFAILFKPKKK